MIYRFRRRKRISRRKAERFGGLSLSQAKKLLHIENILGLFVAPSVALLVFMAAAWYAWPSRFYPWLHLAAFSFLALWFFGALRKAQEERLRFLQGSFVDKARLSFDERRRLSWLRFLARTKRMVFSCYQRLRRIKAQQGFLILAIAGGVLGGGSFLVRENVPETFYQRLAQNWKTAPLLLSAWIVPPGYTGLPSVPLATPVELLEETGVLEIPEGSVLRAFLSESSWPPVLQANGTFYRFIRDENGDYAITQPITKGSVIALSQGGRSLGYWRVKVKEAAVPQVALTAPPAVVESKKLRIAYKVDDEYGVERVSLLITPTNVKEAKSEEISLLSPQTKIINDVDYRDLTTMALAGTPVTLQLRARNSAGREGHSEKVAFTLPERDFTHPVAMALIEERKQLRLNGDVQTRSEVANIMAALARQPSSYRGDSLVLMALRSGAVRLLLDLTPEALLAVDDLLWRTAVRIEEGKEGLANEDLRQVFIKIVETVGQEQQGDFLKQDIEKLQTAVLRYAESSSGARESLVRVELEKKIQKLFSSQNLADATFMRESLRDIRAALEDLKTPSLAITATQKRQMQHYKTIKDIAEYQRRLFEDTKRAASFGRNEEAAKRLANRQGILQRRLRRLLDQLRETPVSLSITAQAMEEVRLLLDQDETRVAAQAQDSILEALRYGMLSILQGRTENVLALSKHEEGRSEGGENEEENTP